MELFGAELNSHKGEIAQRDSQRSSVIGEQKELSRSKNKELMQCLSEMGGAEKIDTNSAVDVNCKDGATNSPPTVRL